MGTKPEDALKNLLDAIMESGAYQELEAGEDGYGPVVDGFEALGLPLPDALLEYLGNVE